MVERVWTYGSIAIVNGHIWNNALGKRRPYLVNVVSDEKTVPAAIRCNVNGEQLTKGIYPLRQDLLCGVFSSLRVVLLDHV